MTKNKINAILAARDSHWPDSVTPVSRLMMSILRCGHLLQNGAARLVADHAISFTEFEVLAALRSQPAPHALQPTEMYSALLISSGGLTKVVNALQTKGLVTRLTSNKDRRGKPVALTSAGKALIEQALAEILAHDGQLLATAMTEKESRQLIILIEKFLNAIDTFKEPAL